MGSCLGVDHGWLCCYVGNGRPDPQCSVFRELIPILSARYTSQASPNLSQSGLVIITMCAGSEWLNSMFSINSYDF